MSRQTTIQSAVTLNPTSFTTTTANRVTNGNNGCTNSASTTYAVLSGNTATSEYYTYYSFNTSSIPQNATINSVYVYGKGNVYNNRYRASAATYSNTSAKSSIFVISATTATGFLVSGGSWTRSDVSSLNLRLYHPRGNRNARYLYFYGADAVINYSVQGTEYEISFNNQSVDVTTNPNTTQYVFQGGTQEIKFIGIQNLSDVEVKDNNVVVTSQLVEGSADVLNTFIPTGNTNNGFTLTDINNAYADANSDNYAQLSLGGSSNGYIYLNFGVSLPANTTILSVTPKVTIQYNRNGSSSGYEAECQMYAGSSYKGQTTTIVTNGGTDVAKTTFTLNSSTWTASELSNARLYIEATNNAGSTTRYLYVYGVSLEVVVESDGKVYTYTISNISADHVISINDVGGTFYNVNASSTYTGATVSPATQSIREGRNATVNISVDNLYEIKVKDNNVDVTNSVVGSDGNYTYTVSNVQTAHTIVVEENTYYTVTVNNTYTGSTGTANPSKVYVGRNSTVNIEVDNLYEIVVKDNGTVVNPTPAQDSTNVSFIPTSFIQSASVYTNIQNTGNGLTNSASTNYCIASAITGSNAESYLVYGFECSSIPENAVIESVTCAVRGRVSSTTYLPTRYAQLYCGNTAKGNQSGNFTTSDSTQTINGGTWTREELDNINVRMIVRRGTSSTGNTASMRFHGATLVIRYSIPCNYTITNIQSNHTITIEEAPYANITTNSTYTGATILAEPTKVYLGRQSVITLNVDNLYEVNVLDNNTDITNNFEGGNGVYRYTITNIQTGHTIVVNEATYYVLTASSTHDTTTITPATLKVYHGQNAVFTINGGTTGVLLKDNGVDVTSSIVNSTYTIQNVTSVHTLVLSQAPRDFVKINGVYRKIGKFYRKVNGSWIEVTKESFDAYVSSNILTYGGHIDIEEIGTVDNSGALINISINDNALTTGTYKLVYEDEHRQPLDNVDKITEFTIN